MVGILNSFVKNQKKVKGYLAVCKKKGVGILPPDVNKSLRYFSYDNGKIRFGLMGLRNMGKISESLIEERNQRGEFKTLIDLVSRMKRHHAFNRRALESLIYAGALDSFEGTRSSKLKAVDAILAYSKDESNAFARQQVTFFDLFEENNIPYNAYDVSLEDVEEIEQQKKIELEEHYAGFYITAHPLDKYAPFLDKNGVGDISFLVPDDNDSDEEDDIDSANHVFNNMPVKVAGIIKELEVRYTRGKGEAMCTFTLEDQSATIKCVTFPKQKEKYNKILKNGSIVVINGKLQKDDFGAQIRVEKVVNAEEASLDTIDAKGIHVLASSDYSLERHQFAFLNTLAFDNPGETEIMFEKGNGDILLLNRKVEHSPEVLNQIQEVFGEQNVQVTYM